MGGSSQGPVWFAAFVLAFACSSAAAQVVKGQRAIAGSAPAAASLILQHYSIEIPAGYEAKDVSPPTMDFALYQVTRRGSKRLACSLYLGNSPNFPELHWSGRKAVETKSDDHTTTAFQRQGAIEGVMSFSGLTYKEQRSGSPWTSVHYLCHDLDQAGMRDMLRMIASIKVVRPHVD